MTHKHLTGAIVSVWRREGYGSTLDQLSTKIICYLLQGFVIESETRH